MVGGEVLDVTSGPAGKEVICPECGEKAFAIVAENDEIVEDEKDADGKVWVNCHFCDNRFLAYFERGE